jgi:hypothetical protein
MVYIRKTFNSVLILENLYRAGLRNDIISRGRGTCFRDAVAAMATESYNLRASLFDAMISFKRICSCSSRITILVTCAHAWVQYKNYQ